MARVRIRADVQQAVDSHVRYMAAHYDPTVPRSVWELASEDPSMSGYTGADDWERIRAAGNTLVGANSHGAWLHASLYVPENRDGPGWAEVVDEEMTHFIYRQKHLQPSSYGVGLAVGGPWRYSFDLYTFPAAERLSRPVVYPVDGQTDVPTSTWNPWALEGYEVPEGEHGYHITVTVGSHNGGSWTDANPYGLSASELELVDESGSPVEFWLVTPDSFTPGPFLYSVAVVPKQPLEPDTTYTFTGRVSWQEFTNKVETTFTTGS